MKPEGFKCPGSHVGHPHGGDKRRERQERTLERAKAKGLTRTVDEIMKERARRAGGAR